MKELTTKEQYEYLEETFDVLEDIYSIADLEHGILDNLFKDKTN